VQLFLNASIIVEPGTAAMYRDPCVPRTTPSPRAPFSSDRPGQLQGSGSQLRPLHFLLNFVDFYGSCKKRNQIVQGKDIYLFSYLFKN